MTETLDDPFVMEDRRCREMMEAALEYHNMDYEDKLDHWRTRQKPSRWPKLLAALSYAEKLIECYDFTEKNVFVLTEKPGYVFGSAMCHLNGRLYTLGGVQSKTVDQYDVERNTWVSHFPSLRHFRVAHGVTVSDGAIFVTGGSAKANANFGPGQYEMETIRLDADNGVVHDWKIVAAMKEARSFLGSAAVNDNIYAIGGCLTNEFSTVEMWSPASGQFTMVANTLCKRDCAAVAVLGGEIWAAGGYDDQTHQYHTSVDR